MYYIFKLKFYFKNEYKRKKDCLESSFFLWVYSIVF